MKLLVKEVFEDKITKRLYTPGEVIEIADKDRIKDMEERKLAEVIKEAKPKTKSTK